MSFGAKFILIALIALSIVAVVLELPNAMVFGYWGVCTMCVVLILTSKVDETSEVVTKKTTKILVVDDDDVNALVVKKMLKRVHPDYDVDSCTNATDALIYLKRNEVDLVLLDLLMPNIRGDYVIRKLKSDAPEMLQRVIVYTSLSKDADEMKDVVLNRVRYVPKPMNDESIQNLIREIEDVLAFHVR